MKPELSGVGRAVQLLIALTMFAIVAAPPINANEMWEELFNEQLDEARDGSAEACYEVGIMYLKGQGVEQDRAKAIEWLKRGAEKGDQQAARKLGRMEEQKSRFETSLTEAESGDIKAQYEVAMMYLKGRGVEHDGKKARQWLMKATEAGDEKSTARLGILNYKGEAGKRDYAQALKLFQSVSAQSALAQYYLGEMYASGEGVSKNMRTAIDWYQKAADNGFDHAHGKIINLEEELKMVERRKQNAAALAAQAEIEAAKAEAAARKAASAKKAKAAPVKAKAPAARKAVAKKAEPSELDRLAGASWLRGKRPVDYLPSKVTQCEMEDHTLVCLSEVIERDTGAQTVHYRVKSVIQSGKDGIAIAYRNLVLEVTEHEEADDQPLGYDDNVEQGYKIRTGWTQEHTVNCRSQSASGLNCVKDNTHRMTLVSGQ